MTKISPTESSFKIPQMEKDEATTAKTKQQGATPMVEAVQFERKAGEMHKLYSKVAQEVEAVFSNRVEEMRAKIASGEYEPNVDEIARRMLGDLGLQD